METELLETESLEQVQARHRKELKELQGRITNKKKNATKKTRKGVNDECAEMERRLREKQAAEMADLSGADQTRPGHEDDEGGGGGDAPGGETRANGFVRLMEREVEGRLERAAEKLHLTDHHHHHHHHHDDGPAAGGDRKKRNRHKDRLARRAAEQEAAARQAEVEAASMTDHRARESAYMKKMFQTYDLVEKEVEPDGHCLFSAMADQLKQHGIPLGPDRPPEPAYKVVRRVAAGFMLDNADDFAPFLDEDLDAYAARVRDTAEWGGQLELMALARRYGAEIRVIQDGRTERIGEDEGRATGKTLWLAYYRHGYGLGEHYNSLRKKTGS
ncbi:hypothetical protein CDD83_789 [Cordyceps sp. RAO-2017]|nr:hypothetical protein CDD83_789 [Cordyceps sp. RAO-2017]